MPNSREHPLAPGDLASNTLSRLSQMLASGATSSRDIVQDCLARINALDTRLHAFIEVYRDTALQCADAADLERKAGFARGPLHGIPIALKDLVHVAGRATTAGAKTWQGRIATETATAVERLLAAGMIPPARRTWSSSRSADGAAISRWARRGTHGIHRLIVSAAGRAAVRRRRSLQVWRRRPSDPTPVDRSAFPRRCAASPALSPRTARSALPASLRWPARSIHSDR